MKKQDVSFKRIIPKLKCKNPDIYALLKNLIDSRDYKKLSDFRNEITHQFIPSSINRFVEKFPNGKGAALTIGKYTTSKEVIEIVNMAFRILELAVRIVPQRD